MRIIIATDGDQVAGHFGQCGNYTVVDVENGREVKRGTLVNNGEHACAGIAEWLHREGAEVFIAGGMGGGPLARFEQLGVQVILGATGPLEAAVQKCIAGALASTGSACAGHGEGESGCGNH